MPERPQRAAALAGVTVLELQAKGPVAFGAMILADLGATVIQVQRPSSAAAANGALDGVERGRRVVHLDLKRPGGVEVFLGLVERADVVIEGNRPGVVERLGIGPAPCLERNPRLIYARVTGWGQTGPLAEVAGHDINFLAITGALHAIGDPDRPPPPPLNLVGDFGGTSTFLVIGVLGALLERARSGTGQVLDVAMIDGIASLTTAYHDLLHEGRWGTSRGANLVDGGTPWYRCYATSDGGFVAVGCLEERFWNTLLERLSLDPADWPYLDRVRWAAQASELERIFRERPRSHWEALFEGTDACVSPVLDFNEATEHVQLVARRSFTAAADGRPIPAPAPRRTGVFPQPAPRTGGDASSAVLLDLGMTSDEIDRLGADGVLAIHHEPSV